MTGVQVMVVLIVAMVMIAQIVKARHGHHRGSSGGDARTAGETARLREELKQLKERLAVLERITVEKENTLERQIEELRDR